MSRLDSLPADQKAVLQLLLKQDRSYEEIATLLRLDPEVVRRRAHSALDNLVPGPDELPPERQDDISDFLLGEQSASERADTRAYLQSSAAGRRWAATTAAELQPLAGDVLPEIPGPAPGAAPGAAAGPAGAGAAAAAAPAAPGPPPAGAPAEADVGPAAGPEDDFGDEEDFGDELAAAPPRSRDELEGRARSRPASRRQGAALIVGVALLVALIVVLLLSAGDERRNPASNAPPATTTATEPQLQAQVDLSPAGEGSSADGTATFLTQGGQQAIALVASGLRPTTERTFYGLWLTRGEQRRFLGFPPAVAQDGRLRVLSPLPQGVDPTAFRQLLVTRETVRENQEEQPQRPGTVVLRGTLQAGGEAQGGGGQGAATTPGG